MSKIDEPNIEVSGFLYNDLKDLICINNEIVSDGVCYDDDYFIHNIFFSFLILKREFQPLTIGRLL